MRRLLPSLLCGFLVSLAAGSDSTGSFVLHTTLSSLTSSGGKRVNGTAF